MVRIATFNVENLFARYKFESGLHPDKVNGFTINDLAFDIYDEATKQITAKLIKDSDIDVLALQEVENLSVLDKFCTKYLSKSGYRHRVLIDSFDPRKIDVAVISRYPIVHVRSYRDQRNAKNTSWLFSRDCLEVDININNKILTLYVNHFKSMIGGRLATKKKREEQAAAVKQIIRHRWSSSKYEGNYIVLGDFNDYPDKETALNILLKHPHLENIISKLPKDEQWTHYWDKTNEYNQIDYILISKSLAEMSHAVKPEIIRSGLPYKAKLYTGKRLKGVGEREPSASDHALVLCDLSL